MDVNDNGCCAEMRFERDADGDVRTYTVGSDGKRRYRSVRMRMLTPREAFRMMDVDDRDIDRIQAAGISRTQQYRMAGNSIVVGCLYTIFREMFSDGDAQSK